MIEKTLVLHDLKFLIKNSHKNLEDTLKNETEKGFIILTTYVAANSLYEKLSSLVLDDIIRNYNQDLRKNSKKLLLLKYRKGKKLNNLTIKEIEGFLENLKNEKFHGDFKNNHKSLGNITELFELLTLNSKHQKLVDKILKNRNLTFSGLQEQLKENYTSDRTKVVHGDYRDIKTLYFLYRGKYLDFLINIYIAMKIMIYSSHL